MTTHIEILRELIYQNELLKSNLHSQIGFWANYGTFITSIITAFTSLGVAFLIFSLTKNKEAKFKREEREKEELEFRRKLYGEALQLSESIVERYILINRLYSRLTYYTAVHLILDKADEKKVYEERVLELNARFNKEKTILDNERSLYKSKVGEYIFHKNKQTKVETYSKEISVIPSYLVDKSEFFKLKDANEIKVLHENHVATYKIFIVNQIKPKFDSILDLILNND
ncbi:MAG: hypothetical protein K0S53_1907 [Bacteroidetes bacterium]|jgi:hypothetical protein|nr:hypothetical protein [Bacteroidota bacterium]